MSFLRQSRNSYRQARQQAKNKGGFQSHLTSRELRNDYARSINFLFAADEKDGSEVIILANVLEKLGTGIPAHLEFVGPGARVGARIVDGHFVVEKVVVVASELLDEVQLFGMRRSRAVHPETFIEADIIDN